MPSKIETKYKGLRYNKLIFSSLERNENSNITLLILQSNSEESPASSTFMYTNDATE